MLFLSRRTTALALSVCIAAATPLAAFAQQIAPVGIVVSQKAPATNHPTSTTSRPTLGWSSAPIFVSGGGARVDWTGDGNLLNESSGDGNLLTESAPLKDPNSTEVFWQASSKDHLVADPAAIEAYANLLLFSPLEWDSYMGKATGAVAAHPVATVTLPPGYIMTGGGCTSNWKTSPAAAGNLLTASFPANANTWECRAKDHGVASPASVTAYVIGIRPKAGSGVAPPLMLITQERSDAASHPTARAPGLSGYVVTGGGALAQPSSAGAPGQLLTASYPEIENKTLPGSSVPLPVATGWRANSKDHAYPSPGTVDAYAVNLRFGDAITAIGRPNLSTPFISSTVQPAPPPPLPSKASGTKSAYPVGKQPTAGGQLTPYIPPSGPPPLLFTARTRGMYVHLTWEPLPNARDYAVFRHVGTRTPVAITSPGFTGNEIFDAVEFPNETYRYSVAVNYPDGKVGSAQVDPRTPFKPVNPSSLSAMRVGPGFSGTSNVRLVWPETYGAIAYRIDGGRLPNTGVQVAGGTFDAVGGWTSAQQGTFTHVLSSAAGPGPETFTIVAIYPHGQAEYNVRTTATLPFR